MGKLKDAYKSLRDKVSGRPTPSSRKARLIVISM